MATALPIHGWRKAFYLTVSAVAIYTACSCQDVSQKHIASGPDDTKSESPPGPTSGYHDVDMFKDEAMVASTDIIVSISDLPPTNISILKFKEGTGGQSQVFGPVQIVSGLFEYDVYPTSYISSISGVIDGARVAILPQVTNMLLDPKASSVTIARPRSARWKISEYGPVLGLARVELVSGTESIGDSITVDIGIMGTEGLNPYVANAPGMDDLPLRCVVIKRGPAGGMMNEVIIYPISLENGGY